MSKADIATGTSPGQTAASSAMNYFCNISTVLSAPSMACGIGSSALPLQQLSPQSAMQAESVAITSPYSFIKTLNKQAQKRGDCQQSNKDGESPDCENWSSSGGSSAYGFIGPFGIMFSGGGGFGDRETTTDQTGFNIDMRQANLMIDYMVNQDLTVGFAFNYVSADRRLGLNSGNLNSDSYRFAPFLSFRPTPNSYITAMGGYARVDFDSVRKVSPFVDTFNNLHSLTDARATYGADEYFASLGAGYTWRMGPWSLRTYGRGDYNHMTIGSFRESGGVDVASDNTAYTLSVNGQSILSVTSTLGAELSYAISTTVLPAVVIPTLHAEWVHEFKNGARQTQATFLAADDFGNRDSSSSSILVQGSERNWANLGFGLQMIFPRAIVGFVNYETLFIENASNQTVTGGIRVSF
ncbi:MAG: autotransporter outer membrane beta-barrel domain-containing protein [Gammaproteobacteria bacterium]